MGILSGPADRADLAVRSLMCNLYSNTMPVDAMRRLFKVKPEHDGLGNAPPLPAIFPRYNAPVVRRAESGGREARMMHWGFLMPQLSKRTGEPILPRAINNARDEKLRTSVFWRESFAERRCLVPASSFCEAKGRAPATYHWFALQGEQERPPFAFAGIWREFRGRYRDELVTIETRSIVTTRPNALVETIHPDRMPVILTPEDHETWLGGSPDEAFELLRPYPAERMRIVRSGRETEDDPSG